MYKPVASKVNFPKMEEEILRSWKENDIFAKSIENRKDDPLFVLYEGPPTANGRPGIHHVLARVFKDVIPRYKTMKGYRAPRNAGWDTHGLPVELEIEKKLGLKSKPEIEKYGIGKFNAECRQSVLQYVDDWNKITERIAYWTDLEHPYITFDNNYIETCWWIIHQLSEKGLIYKGYRVTPHCPRCATSLSSHEVALGYKDNTEDPSVFVKFRLTSESVTELQKAGLNPDIPAYFLAWTTTPWTLPGNTALAVSPGEDYIIVEEETDGTKYQLIFAKPRLAEVLKQPGRIAGIIKGKDIVGLHYEPLFSPGLIAEPVLIFKDHELMSVGKSDKWVYPVIAGDFVVMNEGTGIVHIAPAFGEIDYQIGQEKGLYFIQPVDLAGRMTINIPWIESSEDNINGRFVKQADSRILKDLKSRGLLLRSEKIKHTYPFCWRCNTPLLYYAKSSWYIKTTEEKDNLIKGNEQINWYPEHIKYGRFGDWLKNNVDWAFSRERYWGTPLPVWECDKCHQREFIESRSVLIKKNLHQTEAAIQLIAGTLDLHRPYVDDIVYDCVKCNGVMRRVPEVMDCWFDSGSMPIAQWHYPFENKALLEDGRFPADFISEAVDQTRGWFYSLHALSILLFNKPCFKNVICLGLVMDEKGEKMSKSKGNVVEPWALLNKYGADALRWYLYTSAQPGNVRLFSITGIEEITRKFQLTLWNSYSFFVSYANIDNFSPSIQTSDVKDLTELDKWIVSELNHLILDVTNLLENYDPTSAARKIEEFVDNLSNWYIRRNRRRFWKSESDVDKVAAYNTLYECLTKVSQLLAPFMPFVSEEIYQNLIRNAYPDAVESVHLSEFPVANKELIDEQLSASVQAVLKIVSVGRAIRSKAGLKVRQPLSKVLVKTRNSEEREGIIRLAPQILEELNVKDIEFVNDDSDIGPDYTSDTEGGYTVALPKTISAELADEGIARELVRRIQVMRRTAGFEITDHIITYYHGDQSLKTVIDKYGDYIKQETLSEQLINSKPADDTCKQVIKIQGEEVELAVQKIR